MDSIAKFPVAANAQAKVKIMISPRCFKRLSYIGFELMTKIPSTYNSNRAL